MAKSVRPLKVSTPEGKRIMLHSFRSGPELVVLEVPFLEVVKKDDPPFAANGIIRFNVKRSTYSKSVEALTSYLESLFLIELGKKEEVDESLYSSLGAKPNIRRTKSSNSKKNVGVGEGKRDISSIHSGTRRKKPTESIGERGPDPEVAKVSNSKISSDD